MTVRQSALIVAAPEAEHAVAELRLALDSSAPLGVPAHVTVLYPFLRAEDLDDLVRDRLGRLFGAVPRFAHTFVRTDWFGDAVIWLASDADATFRSLTARVVEAYPEHPPYEGQFDDVVPHLTIADHGSADAMRAAERTVRARLPIRSFAREVTLIVQQPSGRWETADSFPLG